MSDSPVCLKARTSLEEIRTLKQDFEVAYDLAFSSGNPEDIKKTRELKQNLESNIKALQETLAIVEAERLFDLRHQYEAQAALLKRTGFFETKKETDTFGVESETLFVTGIDGNIYPLPSYETLARRLFERKELFRTKADQGFTKLLLVPFGMPLGEMITKFRQYLKDYKNTHKTFGRTDPTFEDFSDEPGWDFLSVGYQYANADANGTLVYDPVAFNFTDHGGKTKAEILAQGQASKDLSDTWRFPFVQAGKNGIGIRSIPRNGQGEPQGEKVPRQDIEAGKSPIEYLQSQLQGTAKEDSAYQGESGMTPEEWIIAFITHLEETGKPMDNYWDATNSITYLAGAYFTNSGSVPNACWHHSNQYVLLFWNGPGDVDGRFPSVVRT